MEFKGTKGKWVISELGEPNQNNGNTGCHTISIEKNIKNIGFIEVWFSDDFTVTTKEEAHANALLISKAPEMLEMLKECMRALSSVQSPATPSILLYREVEQLIKEATEL